MVNYKLGKIYKIVSPSHPEVPPYFGSTCDALSRRMTGHRVDFKRGKNNTASKALMCFDDAIILLVEEYPCDNKEQLHAREGQIMLEAIEKSNIRMAGVTHEERLLQIAKYKIDHKEEIKAQQAKYREEHQEKIKQYRDKYQEKVTCECGSIYAKLHKLRHEKTAKHLQNLPKE